MSKREDSLDSIAKHVSIMNEEVGVLKVDMGKVNVKLGELETNVRWIKKVMGYMAPIVTGIFVTLLGATIKYMFLS